MTLSAIIAIAWNSVRYRGLKWINKGELKDISKMGGCNFITMMASNYALGYISFAFQALGKSCKIVALLLANIFIGIKKYKPLEYLSGIIATLGLVIFYLAVK